MLGKVAILVYIYINHHKDQEKTVKNAWLFKTLILIILQPKSKIVVRYFFIESKSY